MHAELRTVCCLTSAMFVGCLDLPEHEPFAPIRSVEVGQECPGFALSGVLQRAPERDDAPFRRCGTEAGETRWTPHLAADHRRLAVHTNAGTVRLFATDGMAELVELVSPVGRIDATAFSPDGSLLATVSQESGQLAIWHAEDGRLAQHHWVRPPSTEPSYWSSVAFSRDGRRVVTGLMTITDLETGVTTDWTDSRARTIDPVDPVSPGPVRLAGNDEYVVAYGQTWRQITQPRPDTVPYNFLKWVRISNGSVQMIGDPFGRGSRVYGFALSPDGQFLATVFEKDAGGLSFGVFVVGRSTPVLKPSLQLTDGTIMEVLTFSTDGKTLYVKANLRDAQAVVALAMPTLTPVGRVVWPQSSRTSFLGVSPAGDVVGATATETTWWNAQSGARVRTLPFALRSVTWSADGELGAGYGPSAQLVTWRERDGRTLCRVPPLSGALRTLARPPLHAPDREVAPLAPDAQPDSPFVLRRASPYRKNYQDLETYFVLERESGEIVRRFAAVTNAHAELSDDGETLRTLEREQRLAKEEPYVAVWCR